MTADMIKNMSRESLMSIAPAVEQLSEIDLLQLSTSSTHGPSAEAERLLNLIRRVLGQYAPQGGTHNPNGVAGSWPQWVTDAQRANRQWVGNSVAPGQSTGNRGAFNLETGEFISFNSIEEMRAHMSQNQRGSDQDMVNQLMDRINAIKAEDSQASNNGNGFDERV
jgi:hypothetical protein